MGGSQSKSKNKKSRTGSSPEPTEPQMTRLEETKWKLKTQMTKLRAMANAHHNAEAANESYMYAAMQRGDEALARRYATLRCMKKKLREQTLTKMLNLDVMLNSITDAETNRSYTEAITRSTEEINALFISVEEVEKVMAESKEAISAVDKVSQALNISLLSTSEDVMLEVERELEALSKMRPTNTHQLPTVQHPATPLVPEAHPALTLTFPSPAPIPSSSAPASPVAAENRQISA